MSSKSSSEAEALKSYKQASQLEADGRLGDAIALYQRAFKLCPEIEDLIRQERRQVSSSSAPSISNQEPAKPLDKQQAEPVKEEETMVEIENLIQHLESMEISCVPDRKHKGTHISALPAEVIINGILKFLVVEDVQSVEKFAATCRMFYLYARDVAVWRRALRSINCHGSLSSLNSTANEEHEFDLRTVFIKSPRVRFDGLYIATCLYWRQGQNESAFNQPIHAVTYYRYMRLFKNGTVFHALSNDEPVQIVPLMKRTRFSELLHSQSPSKTSAVTHLLTGTWHFSPNTSNGNDLSVVMKSRLMPADLFVMNLKVLSSSRTGAWNKLKWISYENHRDLEVLNYPLDHVKSFMFSRVKSYLFD